MNAIELVSYRPLIITVATETANELSTFDAGAAYTRYLHARVGDFQSIPL